MTEDTPLRRSTRNRPQCNRTEYQSPRTRMSQEQRICGMPRSSTVLRAGSARNRNTRTCRRIPCASESILDAIERSTSSSRRRVISHSPTIQRIESQRIQDCCRCCRCEIKNRKNYIKNIFSNPILYLFLIFVCYSVYIQNYIQTELDSRLKYSSAEKIESVRAVEDAPISTKVLILDSDKIDKCDYALESTGGRILSIGSTQLYVPKLNNIISEIFSSILQLVCSPTQKASIILKPSVIPGECWAFKGSTGTAVIKLYGPIFISGVTLEHIPITIAPSRELSSAPKEFTIVGLMNTNDEGFNFGKFTYNINEKPRQYFEVKQKVLMSFNMVRFEVLSNWGNDEFTCVYRISIHGNLNLSNK